MMRRLCVLFVSILVGNVAVIGVVTGQSTTVIDDVAYLTAQSTTVTDDVDYLTRQSVDSRLQADDVNLMGDQIDLNTGALVFEHTDVLLPGNSDLEVAVWRRKVPGELNISAAATGFRDWSIEFPRVSMLIAKPSTQPNAVWKTNRCTGAANPGAVVHYGVTIQPYEYWNGLNLEIPGQGSRTILDSATGSQWPTGTVKATKDNWALKCIANIGATNGGGEGFIAIAPNGHQYRFDLLFHIPARAFMKFGAQFLQRRLARLVVTEVTDVDGNWVRYTYNSVGLPTRIFSNDGRNIDIAYNPNNATRITTVAANGRIWSYAGSPWLTTVTLPDGRTWSFALSGMNERGSKSEEECPPPNKTASVTHPNGATATYVFAETRHGRTYTPVSPVLSHGPRGAICGWASSVIPKHFLTMSLIQKTLSGPGYAPATWSYSYSGDGGAYSTSGGLPDTKWTQVIDPLGRKTKYFYARRWGALDRALMREEIYNSAAATSPMQVADYTYVTEAAVGVFDMANENVAAATRPRHQQLADLTRGSDTFHTRNTYDTSQSSATYSYGHPTRVERWSSVSVAPRVDDILYAHNKTKWILGLPASITKNGILFDSYLYDTFGHVTEHRKFGATFSTFGYHTLSGQTGALAWTDDAIGQRMQFLSYIRGLPQQVIRRDGLSLYRTVDDNGWVTSEINARGFETGYQYNAVGWLTFIDRPGSWTDTSISYSGLGGAFQQGTTRGNARTTTYYDSLTRPYLVQQDDLTGVAATTFWRTAYNALGLPIFQSFPSTLSSAPEGRTIVYDGLLRVATEAENVSPFATTTHQYLSGNRHGVIDPSNAAVTTKSSAYGSPDNGEPIEVVDGMGATTSITRDIYGKISQIVQSAIQNGYSTSTTRSYWYDSRQRLCRHRAPEFGDELLSYDQLDRLQYSKNGQPPGTGCVVPPSVDRIGRTYDALDRLTVTDYPVGTPDIVHYYDDNGNVTRTDRGSIVWTYAYNELDLMTQEQLVIDARNYAFGHSYNLDGALTSQSSPSGSTFTFAPDGFGRPTKVAVGTTNHISSVVYHPNNLVSSATFANGHLLTQTITSRQAPQVIKAQKAGAALAMQLVYGYEVRGKISSIDDYAMAGSNRIFSYDANGRLLTAFGPWGSGSFVYDGVGNLRSQMLGARTISLGYDGSTNRVSTVTDTAGGGTRSYSYDTRGNTVADGLRTFIYDHANQPTSLSFGATHGYSYDGNRKRVKVVSGSKTVYSIYSKLTGALIYRDEVSDNRKSDYFDVGPAGLRLVNGSPTYTHADLLGSPIAATDATGSVLWRERYTPFGEKVDDPPGNRNDTGFTAHLQDDATKLTYMQARYYDPVIGRFLSTDPIGYQDGLNLYAYVSNDPLNKADPTGQCVPFCTVAIGAFFGAVTGAVASTVSQGITKGFGNVDGGAVLRAAAYGAVTGAAIGSGAAIAGVAVRLAAQTAIGAAGGAASRVTENVVTNRPADEGVLPAAAFGGIGTLAGGLIGTAITGAAVTKAASNLHYIPSPAGPLSVPGAVIGNQVVGTAAKTAGGVAAAQEQQNNDRSGADSSNSGTCNRGPDKC